MKRYWVVQRKSKTALPAFKYTSQAEAESSARYLAARYPGETIVVLESITAFVFPPQEVRRVGVDVEGEG